MRDIFNPAGKHAPVEPHFYMVKLRFAGVYLFFLFCLQNIDCRYSSNVYPQPMF